MEDNFVVSESPPVCLHFRLPLTTFGLNVLPPPSAMSKPFKRHSQLQKDVLSLYRSFLKAIREKSAVRNHIVCKMVLESDN